MAMYQRRSSTESFNQQWRSQSPTGSDRRKLSFNPGGNWDGPAREEPVGAYEVSKKKRILQVGVAVAFCLLSAGPVFGYAALKPVLVNEGVYRDKCTKEEVENKVWVCYEQELRLNLMFTVAAVSTNVCALPVGTILDRFGPRIASLIGVVFITLGALFMAFANGLPFDGYIPGYLFLALGGPFVFISSFQLSNTFPQNSGLILALLTGAFDTSSAVFLAYRLVYQATNGSFTPRKFFLVYLIVPAFILVAQIFIMPGSSYKTVGELVKQAEADNENSDTSSVRSDPTGAQTRQRTATSEVTNLLGSKSGDVQAEQEKRKAETSGVWGALHGKTALQQILSPWFMLITLFTIVQMVRINYFVATIRTQYDALLPPGPPPGNAVRLNNFFDIALPLGGVLSVPFIGLVLDHTSSPFTLGLLVSIATVIGVLGVIPQLWAGYANIVLFVLYRPLYYTAVSDYSAKVFGFATFGKVYGLIICLAGLLNFSQQGLEALTHRVFGNNPIPVNVVLLSLAAVVGVVLVGFVWMKSYTMHREKLEEEAEAARERLMPGADEEEVNREHGHQGYGTA